jgi:hypothetical protein
MRNDRAAQVSLADAKTTAIKPAPEIRKDCYGASARQFGRKQRYQNGQATKIDNFSRFFRSSGAVARPCL